MSILIGAILGGPESLETNFFANKKTIQKSLDEFISDNGIVIECSLDVVLHVNGSVFMPEFKGIRTGSYSSKLRKMQIQIAVGNDDLNDIELLFRLVSDSISISGDFLLKKKRIGQTDAYKKVSAFLKKQAESNAKRSNAI